MDDRSLPLRRRARSSTGRGVVVVVGDVLVDVVVAARTPTEPGSDTPATIRWRQGGAAATTARWLRRAGVGARLVGRVGADLPGRWLAESLAAEGVDAHLAVDPDRHTGTVVALLRPGERDMHTDRGAAAHLAPADLDLRVLDAAAHLHLSGYALLDPVTRPAGLAAVAAARAADVPLSVDPASAAPLAAVGADTLLGWLPRGTLVTPNVAEASLLTGDADPAAAALALAGRVGEAVVTGGADGAWWSDGRAVLHEPAVPVADADPVGAGDAFTAGLLAARLAGADPPAQLRAATALAARAVAPGGTVHRR